MSVFFNIKLLLLRIDETPHRTWEHLASMSAMLFCWRWLYSLILSPLLIIANPCLRWSTSPGICPHAPIFKQPSLIHPTSFFQSSFPSFFSVNPSYLSSLLLPSSLSLPVPPFTSLSLSCALAISTPLSLPSTLVMFTIFSSFLPLPSFANFSPSRQTRYRPYVERMAPEMSEQDYVSQTEWSW